MYLSPSSRLRRLVQRAVFALPSPVISGESDKPSLARDEAESVEVKVWDAVSWNESLERTLKAISFLGGTHPSDWGRLKMNCFKYLTSMTPRTALVCLQLFSRHRACGKTEAMRLQEVVASGYHTGGLSLANQIHALLTLCTLRVGLSAVLRPLVRNTLPTLIDECPPHLLPRVIYAIHVLFGDTIGDDIATVALQRAGSTSLLKDMTASDRIYLLWATDALLSASLHTSPLHVEAFRRLLLRSLGLRVPQDLEQPLHCQSLLTPPEPLTLDVLLGKTRTTWQLQPKDSVLLLHTLSRLISSSTGGDSAIGSKCFDRRRSHVVAQRHRQDNPAESVGADATSLVDGSVLLHMRDDNSLPVAAAAAQVKPHFDALCHRLSVALLSCDFWGLHTACQTLSALAKCGAVYWSTQAQLLMHLLVRYVLFQYRDAVFFEVNSPALHSMKGHSAYSGLVMLREVPILSDEEHDRLVQLRLTTSVESLEQMQRRLRPSPTVAQLITIMQVLHSCDDIFGRSRAASGTDGTSSASTSMTFTSYYRALVAVKLQRAIQTATPAELPRLVTAACRCGALSSVMVSMCVERLALDPDGMPGKAVRLCCQTLHQYMKKHATALWNCPDPPESLSAALAQATSADDVSTSVLLSTICDICANPARHEEMESLWLTVYRSRGTDAANPSELRTTLLVMAKHHVRHFSKRTALQATSPRLLRRACHGASLREILDTLLAAQQVGMSTRAIAPIADYALNILNTLLTTTGDSPHQPFPHDDHPLSAGSQQCHDILKWMLLCANMGSVSLWRATPLAVKEVLNQHFESIVCTLGLSGTASVLCALFTLGADDPRMVFLALQHYFALKSPQAECLKNSALIAATVLLSWRGSRPASQQFIPMVAPTMLSALRAIQDNSDAEKNGHTLWLIAAAATVVFMEPQPTEHTLPLRSEVARCMRLLCATDNDPKGTFSLSKATSLVNDNPGAMDPAYRLLLHPTALCGIAAQTMQSHGEDDSTKLFGAQLWRQCVKSMEKLATTLSAMSAGGSGITGSESSQSESPLTHMAAPATQEEHAYEGLVLMTMVGVLVRCGANSQSLDLLVQKIMRRSSGAVDLVGVGLIAEGLVATKKRRPALTEFIAYVVEEYCGDGAADLSSVPAHLLAAIIFLMQREGDRVAITLARADVVSSVVWSALEQRLSRLPPATIVELVPLCVPHVLESMCQAVTCCVVPVMPVEDSIKSLQVLQQKGAPSKDLSELEAAIASRTAPLHI